MKLFKEVSVNKLSHSRNISKGPLLLCAERVPNFNGVMNIINCANDHVNLLVTRY